MCGHGTDVPAMCPEQGGRIDLPQGRNVWSALLWQNDMKSMISAGEIQPSLTVFARGIASLSARKFDARTDHRN
jgi:hypothetical protein